MLLHVGLTVRHVVAAFLLATEDLELLLCLLALAVPLMPLAAVLSHLLVTLVAGPPLGPLVEHLVVSERTNANDLLATIGTDVRAGVVGPLNMVGIVFAWNLLGTLIT